MPEDELEKLLEDLWYNKDNPFEFLNSLTDLEPLLTVLNDESPQTIAIIASYIKPQLASQLVRDCQIISSRNGNGDCETRTS